MFKKIINSISKTLEEGISINKKDYSLSISKDDFSFSFGDPGAQRKHDEEMENFHREMEKSRKERERHLSNIQKSFEISNRAKRISSAIKDKVRSASPYGREFRKRFRFALLDRGFSVSEFAEITNSHEKLIRKYFNDEYTLHGPLSETLLEYAVALNCDPLWLAGIEGSAEEIPPFKKSEKTN